MCFQEEEEERSDCWNSFLDRQAESAQLVENKRTLEKDDKVLEDETEGKEALAKGVDGHETSNRNPTYDNSAANGGHKEELPASDGKKFHRVEQWTEIRSSLHTIEEMMSARIKKRVEGNRKSVLKDEQTFGTGKPLSTTDEAKSHKGACDEDSDEEFYDVERSDPSPEVPSTENMSVSANGTSGDALLPESSFPWKEELEVLVRGGVPMALRGEVLTLYL